MTRRACSEADLGRFAPKGRVKRYVRECPGLVVVATPKTPDRYVLRYVTADGQPRRWDIGALYQVDLAEAIERARRLRVEIAKGFDPAGERASRLAASPLGETMQDLVEAFWRAAASGLHGGRSSKAAETLRDEQSLWLWQLKSGLADRKFDSVRRHQLVAVLQAIAKYDDHGPVTARRAGRLLEAVFAFAVLKGRLDRNPAHGFSRQAVWSSAGFDTAATAELFAALRMLSSSEAPRPRSAGGAPRLAMALALQFLVLTLATRSEVAGARWSEIDLSAGLWCIDGDRAAGGRPRLVPLSASAVAVLQLARQRLRNGHYVFPSPLKPHFPLEDRAITRAMSRMCESLKIPGGSPQDIRRNAAKMFATQTHGFDRAAIRALLGRSAVDARPSEQDLRRPVEAWAAQLLGVAPDQTG